MIYLDTHAALWLLRGDTDWLTAQGRTILDRETDLRVSPAVLLELQLLWEIQRIAIRPDEVMLGLLTSIGLRVCPLSFDIVVHKAFDLPWTRDPFDRMVVAHAAANNAPLMTQDKVILKQYQRAFH